MQINLPDKWYLPKATTDEEAILMCDYINKSLKTHKRSVSLWTKQDCYSYYVYFEKDYYCGGDSQEKYVSKSYTKLSFDDFKKFILKIEEPEVCKIQEDLSYLIPIIKRLENAYKENISE